MDKNVIKDVSVSDYMSMYKKVYFTDNQICQIRELINFYRIWAPEIHKTKLSEVAEMNLDTLEKLVNTAVSIKL